MTTIRCWEYACIFNTGGACNAGEMEYHPDHGCLTFEESEDYEPEAEWEESFTDEEEEWEDEDVEDEELDEDEL